MIKKIFNYTLWFVFLFSIFSHNIEARSLKITAYNPESIINGCDNWWGDLALLESGGKYMLVDTLRPCSANKVISILKDKGIKQLDILISHMDKDHVGGLDAIMESNAVKVNNLYLQDPSIIKFMKSHGEDITSKYNLHIDKAKKNKVNIIYLKKGDSFTFGDAKVNVVGPVLEDIGKNKLANYFSLCTKFIVGSKSYLSCGDSGEKMGDKMKASGANLSASVFKFNHHGQPNGGSSLLKAANPDFGYAQNRYEYIHALSTLRNNGIAYSTRINGHITYLLTDDNVEVLSLQKNYKTIKFQYYDKDDNKLLKEVSYPINNGDTFNPKTNWYKYFIEGYRFDSVDVSSSKKINSNTTIKVFYKKDSSVVSSKNNSNNDSDDNINNNDRPVLNGPSNNIGITTNQNSITIVNGDAKCGGEEVLKVIKFIMELINIVFFIIPIALIVLLAIDFTKNVIAEDEGQMKKNFNLAIKRLIYIVILFLVPVIIRTTASIVSQIGLEYAECIKIATTEDLSQYRIEYKYDK